MHLQVIEGNRMKTQTRETYHYYHMQIHYQTAIIAMEGIKYKL
jgi:hypothetical protein